jgi:hypothetical protein
VIKTYLGVFKGDLLRSRNGVVEYAERIPKGPAEGKLDIEFPGIASIVGELAPISAGGVEFQGDLEFHGNGGFLDFDADAVAAEVSHSAEEHGPGSDLFSYLPSTAVFSNQNSQVLTSQLRSAGRLSFFVARLAPEDPRAGFAVETLEWLPGRVAVRRDLEVVPAPGTTFEVSSKAEHPKSATVKPPAPFSGSAVYRRMGSIRSPRGKLTGSLAADIWGVKVRLAGAKAKSFLINLHPGF